jgi:hypothetical protein
MMKPALAIYYEHPDWFRPLFYELDRRDVTYVQLNAAEYPFYDPADRRIEFDVLFNRMSPSAHLRDSGSAIVHTQYLLAHLERLGVRIINGSRAYGFEISKALQLTLLAQLGLPAPPSRVIHRAGDALPALEGLRFPVIVKANIGGSGAGIVRFDSRAELESAVEEGRVHLGLDNLALVQEFIPPRGGYITRVETLKGKFLYAINVYPESGSFDLCPADACQTRDGTELLRSVHSACAVDAPKRGLRVEAVTPSEDVIEACERIAQQARIEVGGIESMIDDRDGRRLYYDVNALSNFVADAPRVIGFDPHARLVDFLVDTLAAVRR